VNLYDLQDIIRRHGNRTVLSIPVLSIEAGKIYTLIGPNGAGKTSLLKILSFLDLPTSGSMQFMEERVILNEKNLYELRRDVVLLDQSPIMFTGSVFTNIEFGLKVRKIPAAERKKRVQDAMHLVGMEKFADYDAAGLSGGETKRVALARALVLQPKVLLCDEPTANVDSENQEIILDILKTTNRSRATSVIFSTHYLSQGQRLADHTLLLQHGSLSDLVNENIFQVTVQNSSENERICQLTGQLFLRLPEHAVPKEVEKGKLHIDPSQIICSFDKQDRAGENELRGHVIEMSQQNGNVRLVVDVGVKLSVYLEMKEYRRERPAIGDKLSVRIPRKSMAFSYNDL
jgi:tungstate transport system ATP-binding protein